MSKQVYDPPKLKGLSRRWTVAFVGFWGMFFNYALRINISRAMICMVKPPITNTTEDSTNHTMSDDPCIANRNPGNSTILEMAEFEWSRITQGWVLSSFFFGYMATQLIGGTLAGRLGTKLVFGVGIAIAAVCSLFCPLAARTDVNLLIALRVIIGLATGISFPAYHTLWGKWAPPLERSKLITFCYAGSAFGNVVIVFFGGFMCNWREFDNGWPTLFYIPGGLCLIWLIFWVIFVHDSPAKDPRITPEELEYIEGSQGINKSFVRPPVPWRGIFTSTAVWAIVVCHFCNTWGIFASMTTAPQYMQQVLRFTETENGVVSSVPIFLGVFAAIGFGQLADYIRINGIWTTLTVRKVFQCVGFFGIAICSIIISFLNCYNRGWAVFLQIVTAILEPGSRAGYVVNYVDIAPFYAGELFGIGNTIGTLPGIIGPLIITAMTPNGTQQEWQGTYFLSAGITTFGAIVFIIFARADQQPWALVTSDLDIKKDIFESKETTEADTEISLDKVNHVKYRDVVIQPGQSVVKDVEYLGGVFEMDNSKPAHDNRSFTPDVNHL
ncbi:unnamed protein product [Owenia fusiformis]|uniref:Sialin n=1 Tax=Owenia fusiformis TaxID=6347 RepID=A0A8J1TUD5_OWEFU|nr:unnamed protein product [Owenia fusiformis]